MIVVTPHSYVADALGRPLDAGTIVIGVAGQDPDTHPIQAWWDAAMTLPAAQPVALSMGYVVNGGARADLYVDAGDYSLRLRDSSGRQVDLILGAGSRSSAAPLASPAFTGMPSAPTQAASDQSSALATDAFVWEHGFAYPGALGVLMTSTALTQAILGGGVYVQGSGLTVTLPDLTQTAAGQTVTVVAGPNGCTVSAVMGETVVDPSGISYTASAAALPLAAGQSAVFASQGTSGPWRVTMLAGASGANGAVGHAGALRIVTNGTGNVLSTIAADSIVLGNGNGGTFTASAVSLTANIAASGVNGLDTGTAGASTWYYVFVIYNPTTRTTAALFSASATAPALPGGYSFFARVGAVRTNASSVLLPTIQHGRRAQYIVTSAYPNPVLNGGAQGNSGGSSGAPTWVAASVAALVPPTAGAIHVQLTGGAQGGNIAYQSIAAPNNAYGGNEALANRPPLVISTMGDAQNMALCDWWLLESADVYYASNDADASLFCLGWEDNP